MNFFKDTKFGRYLKNAGIGFLCILLYFIIPIFELEYLHILNIDYDTMPIIIKVFYLIVWEIITMCILAFILNKKLTKDFNDIRKNHKKYFKKYFKFWLISVGIMLVSNLFINLMNNGIAGNEESLRETFKISPLYIWFSSVIYAPLVEELVFRQSIKNIIPNKILFVLMSGLIFGGLHVVSGYSGPLDLLYLIPYCAPGFAFAYILADSDNIFISTGLHLMHNGILLSLQFILLIFS